MAMIAGAAGQGMIGAWPQIKIVSVRATNAPLQDRTRRSSSTTIGRA